MKERKIKIPTFKVTKSNFLDWFISDKSDIIFIGAELVRKLKKDPDATFNIDDLWLLATKDSIPLSITDKSEEYESSSLLELGDIKKSYIVKLVND